MGDEAEPRVAQMKCRAIRDKMPRCEALHYQQLLMVDSERREPAVDNRRPIWSLVDRIAHPLVLNPGCDLDERRQRDVAVIEQCADLRLPASAKACSRVGQIRETLSYQTLAGDHRGRALVLYRLYKTTHKSSTGLRTPRPAFSGRGCRSSSC